MTSETRSLFEYLPQYNTTGVDASCENADTEPVPVSLIDQELALVMSLSKNWRLSA
jgi:hypothetical protein